MASGEITKRLGVSRQRVQQLTCREDFPAPYTELSLGRIWLESEIELWILQCWRPRTARSVAKA
ncbi:putative DNA-binding transcriptional regulator AlpA [Actinoplanes octamycinicus]|uniref:Putative DNA-binding transcriptional regulator AlpA n=1 Tax=Actinoplanes octamycinicus TaxID=135948 RepID=A0A7W7H4N7_9ACTN|nr:putative DNA-binding transcriptional regulator AlpA [Actinoplanes octamycinicus]